MAGPRTLRSPGNGVLRVREAEYTGAPLHVSDEAKTRNVSTSKSARNFQRSPQSTAALTERPSTSGEVSTRKPIERPGTKDDLHVNPLEVKQFGTTYYNFPLPGSLYTAATPRAFPSRIYSPDISEPEDIGSNYTHTHMEIGMALGSPTHQPTVWSPHVQFRAPVSESSPESLEEWKSSVISPKQKASKWKKFGGLFGKKSSDSSVGFSQIRTVAQTVHEADYMTFPEPPIERTRGRARTTSERKTSNYKPEIQRANTVPTDFQFQESKEKPKGPKQFPVLMEIRPPEIQLDGGPLLDVDIPTTEMERYSVMFGSVINPNTSASSLLARRQATLDKLKLVNEAIAEHERQESETKAKLLRPRRATSPQPTKSPAISLFPTSSRTQRDGSSHAPRRASPLHRSNTSPAALSPNRQTFEPLRPHYEEHTIMLAPTPTLQSAATLTSPWSPDESFNALESPSSPVGIEEVHDSAPLKPRLTEPKWEMVSLHIDRNDPTKDKPLKFDLKLETHLQKLSRKESLQSSLDALARAGAKEEVEELIKTAVDVSIARQISMSRRQRQLLVPIKPKIANVGPIAVGEEEFSGTKRLLVNGKKPMMPRLVNVQAGRIVRSEMAVFDRA